MKSAQIGGGGLRIVILDSGEEAFATLAKFANDAGIAAASLTAVGAFERATVGWFDFEIRPTYSTIRARLDLCSPDRRAPSEAIEISTVDRPSGHGSVRGDAGAPSVYQDDAAQCATACFDRTLG